MAWCPRQTPSVGTDAPSARTSSTLMPAFSGRDGPGEITIASGASARTSATVTPSLRATVTSAPMRPSSWTRFQVNES